jgi:phosphoribosylformylglycinamidine cyclo-ligase
MDEKLTYQDSGVDIDAGNKLVDEIKPVVKSTFDKNVIGGIGSFAGAYALPTGYKEPVLLSATDGVGTKLKIAIDSKKLDTVGIDLVAMCVNDLICNFATPMFFLDYYATSKLEVNEAKDVISGIAEGCKRAKIALIGGETAEMPGLYAKDDFDLAGFSVGIAEKNDLDKFKSVSQGDQILALPSSGIHSNGFSLVRKLFSEKLNIDLDEKFEGTKTLQEILLAPTRIYVEEFLKFKPYLKALAHITGGGIIENIPRVLPENANAKIEEKLIKKLPIFELISKFVEKEEMFRTFNMGVGMIFVVDKKDVDKIISESDAYLIGEITEGSQKVDLV